MSGSSRVTIVGPARRADLTLPSEVPVAELVPELVQMLDGAPQAGSAPGRWSLLRVGGDVLDPERSLDDQAVLDGTMLFLRDVSQPPPEPVVEDIVEAVAIAVDVRPGRWTAGAAGALWLAVAGASVVGAAVALVAVPGLAERAALSVGVGGLAAATGAVLRAARQPLASAVVSLAGLPVWAGGGAAVAAAAGSDVAGVVGGAAVGLTVGALAAWLAAPCGAAPAGGVCVLGLPLAVVAVAGGALGAGSIQDAAVLAVAWLAVIDFLPRLATAMAGLRLEEGSSAASAAALRARVDRGHRVLAWLLAGAALGLTGALLVLAASGAPAAWALCGVAALAAGLRARRPRFTAQVLALAAPGLAGILALELAFVISLRELGAGGALAGAGLMLASAGVALGMALAARTLTEPSTGRRRPLDFLELLTNLALIPLMVGALGLYNLVFDLAHRMG